ncbi:MAG: hypothetical protein HOD92_20440 [Deltaproteobacteria bacterium]|jgi:hypothetical protein|nr:hypothetical protein [Deltaproteobacteria bacterium]
MTDVKNIGISNIKPDLKVKNEKPDPNTDKAFDQLLENLKTMESEIDSTLLNPVDENPTAVSNSVNTLSNYIKRIEGMVEKISSDHQVNSNTKSYAISQYEQNSNDKKS